MRPQNSCNGCDVLFWSQGKHVDQRYERTKDRGGFGTPDPLKPVFGVRLLEPPRLAVTVATQLKNGV